MSDRESLTADHQGGHQSRHESPGQGAPGHLRLIQAEFKRIEVDERIEVDDARALAVLDKMVKQRRDSAQQ